MWDIPKILKVAVFNGRQRAAVSSSSHCVYLHRDLLMVCLSVGCHVAPLLDDLSQSLMACIIPELPLLSSPSVWSSRPPASTCVHARSDTPERKFPRKSQSE